MTTIIVAVIGPILGTLLGFFAGWGLFELTERRKARTAQRALRDALVAELHHTEVLLSTIVGKYSFTAKSREDIETFAEEIRWFVKVGKKRAMQVGLALAEPREEAVRQFDDLSNEQVVALFAQLGSRETTGTNLILPVVDSVLAGRTSGFSRLEIQALSTVRWQAYLLEQEAEWTKEFLRLSFTVADATNHAIVTRNHDARVHSYSRRAITLLKCVRSALTALGATA